MKGKRGYLHIGSQDLGEETLIVSMLLETFYHEIGYQDIQLGLYKRLFHMLTQHHVQAMVMKDESKENQLTGELLYYLYEHKRKVTRQELAALFHYHEDHITRVLKKHTGLSLKEINHMIILEEASFLLLNSNNSINEIIRSLGFINDTNFYQMFYKRYGKTPAEYRNVVK